jgi:hypothetical protein
MTYRALYSSAALLALFAAPAAAQFTAAVQPPRKEQPAAVAAAAGQAAARHDSVTRTTLTDMKAWVDSAAVAVAAAPTPVSDTVVASAGGETQLAPTHQTADSSFKDGSLAPDTATPLPLLALLGVALLLSGFSLVWRDRT